jgi:hypothetical protein
VGSFFNEVTFLKDRDRCQSVVIAVKNLRVPYNAVNFLAT